MPAARRPSRLALTTLTITQVARLAKVNVETVRFYEREGLIEEPPRGTGGSRHYRADVVDRIRFIRLVKKLGFPLTEIAEMLNLTTAPEFVPGETEPSLRLAMEKVNEKITALLAIREAVVSTLTRKTPPEDLIATVLHSIDAGLREEKLTGMLARHADVTRSPT